MRFLLATTESPPPIGHVLEHMSIGAGIAIVGVSLMVAAAAVAFFRAVS
jgi:hypothetical protein